jgi:hypothetical protein
MLLLIALKRHRGPLPGQCAEFRTTLISRPQSQELTVVICNVDFTTRPLRHQTNAACVAVHQTFFQHDMAIGND